MAAWIFRVFLVFVLIGLPIAPSICSATELSLSQAIEIGLKKSPLIKAGQFEIAASSARTAQIRSGLYPRVGLNGAFKRTTNPMWSFGTKLNQEQITASDFDPRKLNNPDPINNFTATISLTYPLYNHGQTRVGIEQAGLGENEAAMKLRRIRHEVIVRIVISYFDVLLAMEQLRVIEDALKTAQPHYRMIQARFDSGVVVKSDLLRAEVRVADLERQRLQAFSNIKVARSAAYHVDPLRIAQMLHQSNTESRTGSYPSPEGEILVHTGGFLRNAQGHLSRRNLEYCQTQGSQCYYCCQQDPWPNRKYQRQYYTR